MSTVTGANVHPNSINDTYTETFSVIGKQTEIQQIRTIQVPKKAGPKVARTSGIQLPFG